MGKELLSLANVCEGKLEQTFQELYPAVISSLPDGGSGGISITIKFTRVKNTATMVNTEFALKPQFPARKRGHIAEITGEGRLRTEVTPPSENLFAIKTAGAGANESKKESVKVD